MKKTAGAGLILAAIIVSLGACQSSAPLAGTAGQGKSAALRNMENVAIAAYRCWFAGSDATFRNYSFANELNSFSGRPRFLLVPKGNFGGKPLLVVQAEGAAGKVTAFGPLMDGPQGKRISNDVSRWAAGDARCGGAA